jgi:hypothetical protein
MRGFAVGMRANSRLSKRGWQIVAVVQHGPAEPLPP